MVRLTYIVARLLDILPSSFKNVIFEFVFNYFPIRLIQKIPCSYSAYLKCYYPKSGDVILDCGAHVGNCALLFSRLVGKEGLVIVLEPLEASFNIIKRRARRLKTNNILPINKGVWNKSGTYSLSVFENTISCKIIEEKNDPSMDFERIIFITIDDLTEEFGFERLDLIKMDIEGAEIEALEGAEKVIKNLKPHFAIASYHEREGKKTYYKVEEILSEKEYEVATFFPPHLTTCGKRKAI